MKIAAITPAMWQVLDRMKRAGVLLAWQRGNGRDYPDTVWWLHGIYSGYQVPHPVSVQGLIDRGLIAVVEIGEPPANVWRLGLTDVGERVWGQERAA